MKIFAKEYYERRRFEEVWREQLSDACKNAHVADWQVISEYSPGWSELEWRYTDGDDVVGD